MTSVLTRWADQFDGWVASWAARWGRVPVEIRDRVVGLGLAVPSWVVLGVARWLEPAAAGFGTHRQLGLSPCSMLAMTGYPCPMCGMTTTFSHMAHLHFVEAFFTQPYGVVLFSLTVGMALIGTVDLIGARGVVRGLLRRLQPYEVPLAWFLLFGLGGGWVYKVLVMHPELLGR